MHPTAFFAQTHHAVAFQCREKDQPQTMNQFQVLGGSIPTIKQDAFRLDFLGKDSIDHHFRKVLVLGLAVLIWRINAIVNWIEIFLVTSTMYQIDDANATYQT